MTAVVTVIIPVGPRHKAHLKDALASCDRQTFTNFNIDVIDDQHGRGTSWARNAGLAAATTPYVTFLDADDALSNTALEMLLKGAALYPEASYIYGDSWTADKNQITGMFYAQEFDRQMMLRMNLHNVTALIPTYAANLIRFDPVIRGWEDWDFYVRLALAGYCGKRLPTPIITYRIDAGSNRADSAKVTNLYASIFAKYQGVTAMGCCGSKPDNVAAAQEALKLSGGDGRMILMEYTAPNIGPIARRINGRSYRGAQDGINSRVWADPRDVAALLDTELWRLAPTPSVEPKPFQFSTDSVEPAAVEDSIAPEAQAENIEGATPYSKKAKARK